MNERESTGGGAPSAVARRWRRRCVLVLLSWAIVSIALSFRPVRAWVAAPLVEHNAEATGEVAYVMAGGEPYFKRLRAASDLYHWRRVKKIIVLNEQQKASYDFVKKESRTRVSRAIDYLEHYGVPRESVMTVDPDPATSMGSLSEARAVAAQFPKLETMVVVTSAPHTRRSGLAFRRAMDENTRVTVYSASATVHSAEIYSPLWIEYAKLVVYYFVA